MLNVKIDETTEKVIDHFEIDGTGAGLVRESLLVIGYIYAVISEKNEKSGELFREHITRFALDDDFWAAAQKRSEDKPLE